MPRRVSLQPAWILHRRAYRDSSLLLDVLTPEYGRLCLVARGQRQGRQAGQLQALRPLRMDFVQRGELGSLGRFEATGPPMTLQGMALWSAFYLNELLLRLLPADDADAGSLFDIYARTLHGLQSESPALMLRWFEYRLLTSLGYGLDDGAVPAGATGVSWDAGHGLVASARGVPVSALQALQAGEPDPAILPAKPLLADMLRSLLGPRPLHSATMLRELVDLQRRDDPGSRRHRHGAEG